MEKKKIYVASSWRNKEQPFVVAELRHLGHEVYDFRNPPGAAGFGWSNVDENWKDWTHSEYVEHLDGSIATKGFNNDFNAMQDADVCVLVLPCGASAHTEAGWMSGMGKQVYVFGMPPEPELMYKLFTGFIPNMDCLGEIFAMPGTECCPLSAVEQFGRLPPWIEVQGVRFELQLIVNGTPDDIRLVYAIAGVDDNSPHKKRIDECGSWRNPYTGGLQGFLFLVENISTEMSLGDACDRAEKFLKRFDLWKDEELTS